MRNRVHNIAQDMMSIVIERLQQENICNAENLELAARVYRKTARNFAGLAKEMAKHEADATYQTKCLEDFQKQARVER